MARRIRVLAASFVIVTLTGAAVTAFHVLSQDSGALWVERLAAGIRHPARMARAVRRTVAFANSGRGPTAASLTIAAPLKTYQFSVKPTHPRVWLDETRLTRLRGFAARNTPRWRQVKAAADAAVDNAKAEAEALPVLGMAFQVTGHTAYCTRAATLLRSLAVPGNDLSGDHYYNYRFDLRDIIAGYDWCHSTLTTADRRRIAQWLMDRADQVWPETNSVRAEGWAIDAPGNNYYYGFMMSWAAALASWGDDPGTHPVSGPNRPSYHVQLALNKWHGTVRPLLDSWGRGGVFAESTNYDSIMSMARLLDGHLTATGQNLADEPGFDFVRDSILWRIHATTPSKAFVYPLGDQPRVSLAELSSYDRLRMLTARSLISDPVRRAFAQHWLDTITPATSQWSFVHAWEFLDYDETAPSTDYTTSLSTSYFAPGPGVLLDRSSWSADATYFGIWAGPVRESHQSRDANGFKIWRGGWLAGDANIWSHSGILGETVFHNNLTFGGLEQTWVEPSTADRDDAARVESTESTADYVFFAGQAARAYGLDRETDRPHVTDYLRRLLYIRSEDAFIIDDRVALAEPSRAIEWHLHAQHGITVSNRSWRFDNGTAALHGESLLPAGATALSVTEIRESAYGARSSARLDVISKTGNTSERLQNVLRIRPMGQTAPAKLQAIADAGGTMNGTVLGTWLVLIARDERASAGTSWRLTGGATRSLLAGLRPASRYVLTATDGAGGIRPARDILTSDAGIARVHALPGDAAYTLDLAARTAAAVTHPASVGMRR